MIIKMKKNKNDTCFVIPAFNEENKIFKIIKELKKIGEVIVIDDCSNDKTNYLAKKGNAKVIKHLKNYGYDHALYTGFKKAYNLYFKFVITIDADGQHSINDAKKILAFLKRGYSIVCGKRTYHQRLMETIFSSYTKFSKKIEDPLCGLKGYNIKTCKNQGLLDRKNNIGTKVLFNCCKNKLKIMQVKINTKKRKNNSRFGGIFKGNYKILNVFIILLFNDLMNLFLPKKNI
tara:strand:+ start:146 stop:841 length:696 start_codon:yes stop_codon:yes gene_type:complete